MRCSDGDRILGEEVDDRLDGMDEQQSTGDMDEQPSLWFAMVRVSHRRSVDVAKEIDTDEIHLCRLVCVVTDEFRL